MKRTLFLLAILVPVTVLGGLLWESGGGLLGSTPSLARKAAGRSTEAASRPRAVSMAEGSGQDLFVQEDADALIGDKLVKYPKTFAAAASYVSGGPGIVLASEPILVFNPKPKSEHDVARLLSIETAGGGKRAARDLAAKFAGRTGIRAHHAKIVGDVDLSRISRIEFTGAVEGAIIDAEVPDDETRIATEKLVIVFDNREIVSVGTDVAFTLTRPRAGDLTLAARGLDLRLRDHCATLHHDIRIETVLSSSGEGSRQPLVLTTPGPIEVEIGRKPGKSKSFTMAGSHAATSAGVAFTQGDLTGTADRASVTCSPGASKIETLDLSGNVRIVSPDGEVQGAHLVATPQDLNLLARIEGKPVTVRLDRRSTLLPETVGQNATLVTNGAVLISPVRVGPDGAKGRTVEVGPGVSITSSAGNLKAERAVAWKSADPDAETAFRVTFDTADGHDDETTLTSARLSIVRRGSGIAADDEITLEGPYEVVHRPKAALTRPPEAPSPDSRRDVPNLQGNPLSIKGGGALEITRPASLERPLVIVVRKEFHMEALGATPGKPRGTLDAEAARAVLESSGLARAPGVAPVRQITSFTAEKRVRIDLPDRAKARGEKLVYDGLIRRVTLTGGSDVEPARIQRTVPGSRDWLQAGTIVFHQDILLVVATSSVDAELSLAPLPWIGDARRTKGETVLSKVHAQRLTASLDGTRYAQGQIVPADVTAELAVKLVQPGRSLACDYARFESGFRSGTSRGSPLRYLVERTVDGQVLEEGLTCPALTVDGRSMIVEGPAVGVFHAKPFLPGKSLKLGGSASRESAPAAEPLEAVTFRCSRQAVIDEDSILAEGRIEMVQGRPPADGMKATADEAIVFLEKKSPADSRSRDKEVGLVVLRGHATYLSRDFDAACDVMKMNQVTKLATLFNETETSFTIILHRNTVNSAVDNGMSRLDIDFKDPSHPQVVSHNYSFVVRPDSRSSGR